jgi:hypothetical protein
VCAAHFKNACGYFNFLDVLNSAFYNEFSFFIFNAHFQCSKSSKKSSKKVFLKFEKMLKNVWKKKFEKKFEKNYHIFDRLRIKTFIFGHIRLIADKILLELIFVTSSPWHVSFASVVKADGPTKILFWNHFVPLTLEYRRCLYR